MPLAAIAAPTSTHASRLQQVGPHKRSGWHSQSALQRSPRDFGAGGAAGGSGDGGGFGGGGGHGDGGGGGRPGGWGGAVGGLGHVSGCSGGEGGSLR